jgi:hypothetical protein
VSGYQRFRCPCYLHLHGVTTLKDLDLKHHNSNAICCCVSVTIVITINNQELEAAMVGDRLGFLYVIHSFKACPYVNRLYSNNYCSKISSQRNAKFLKHRIVGTSLHLIHLALIYTHAQVALEQLNSEFPCFLCSYPLIKTVISKNNSKNKCTVRKWILFLIELRFICPKKLYKNFVVQNC